MNHNAHITIEPAVIDEPPLNWKERTWMYTEVGITTTKPLLTVAVFDNRLYLKMYLSAMAYAASSLFGIFSAYELTKTLRNYSQKNQQDRQRMRTDPDIVINTTQQIADLSMTLLNDTAKLALYTTKKFLLTLSFITPIVSLGFAGCHMILNMYQLIKEYHKPTVQRDNEKITQCKISITTNVVVMSGIAILFSLSNPLSALGLAVTAAAFGLFFGGLAVRNAWCKYQQLKKERRQSYIYSLDNSTFGMEEKNAQAFDQEKQRLLFSPRAS